MEKAYVILKKGFEYDDSVYNSQDGGHPSLIVFSKKEAYEKLRELNIKEFKENSISDYSYEIDEILNVTVDEYRKFNDRLMEKYGSPIKRHQWESFDDKLHPSANEDEVNEYLKMVSFSFYEVVETDIDIQSFRNEQINQILS